MSQILDNYKSDANRFKIENKRIYNIIELMCNDEFLSKAIYYNDEDALEQEVLPNKTDLERIHILEDNVVPDIQKETNTIINVYYNDITSNNRDPLLDNGYLVFDIYINKDNRYLSEGTRLSVIKSRLDDLFQFSRDIIGKGIATRKNARYQPPNMFYIVYQLVYKTIESK